MSFQESYRGGMFRARMTFLARTDVGRRYNAAAGECRYVARPRLVVVSHRDVTNDPTMLTAEHAVYINQLRALRHIHIPETHDVEAPADVGSPPPGLRTPPRSPESAPASPCPSDATAQGTPTSFHARRSPRSHSNTLATPVRTHHADSPPHTRSLENPDKDGISFPASSWAAGASSPWRD